MKNAMMKIVDLSSIVLKNEALNGCGLPTEGQSGYCSYHNSCRKFPTPQPGIEAATKSRLLADLAEVRI